MLREISVIWSLLHVLIIFAMFFESRYSKKKTLTLTLCTMIPLLLFNLWCFMALGPERTGQIMALSLTLPSLVIFFLLAKHQDGRFLFTFCAADTVSLEITYITNMIDHYTTPDTHLVMFLLRLILFPLLEWAALKWLRGPYIRMQQTVKKGWAGFAAISALFYALLLLMYCYPNLVIYRPEYLPAVIIVMILMPYIYWSIFYTLSRQQELYLSQEQTQLLLLQSNAMQQRVEQTTRAEKLLSIQRHDLRHRFQTLDTMLEKGDLQAARDYIASAEGSLEETKVKRWCLNPVLDAMFASYFRKAEAEQIRVEADMDIPEELHVDAAELSVVFANALENAIHAAKQLPAEERIIRCKCIRYPQLMLRVSNPYSGEIQFDNQGYPVADDNTTHGIGTRSIQAYCVKHDAFCTYKAENGWFTIQIVQP